MKGEKEKEERIGKLNRRKDLECIELRGSRSKRGRGLGITHVDLEHALRISFLPFTARAAVVCWSPHTQL